MKQEKRNEVYFGICLSLSMIAAVLFGLFILKTTGSGVLATFAAILAACWSALALLQIDSWFR